MSRRSIIRDIEEETVKEAEVVMRWSKKRIVIAIFLCIVLILVSIYGIYKLGQNTVKILGIQTKSDRPHIKLPEQKSVEKFIEDAKKNLSDINVENLAEKQPQLKKVIEDLTHLTGSSSSARNLICDMICK